MSSEENKKFAYITGVTIMNKWDVMSQEELKKQPIDSLHIFIELWIDESMSHKSGKAG